MNLSEIKTKSISDLIDIATDLGIEDVGRLKKQDIIFRIFKHLSSKCKKGILLNLFLMIGSSFSELLTLNSVFKSLLGSKFSSMN